MPLVPCESCGRHVRAGEDKCPFCATPRARTLVAAVAMGLVVSCGTKYGGPPVDVAPPPPPATPATAVSSTPIGPAAPTVGPPTASAPASASAAPSSTPTAAATGSSPRLQQDAGRVIAPATKYGGPPLTKPRD